MKKVLMGFGVVCITCGILGFACAILANSTDFWPAAVKSIVYKQPLQINNTLRARKIVVTKDFRADGLIFSKEKYGKNFLKIADSFVPAKNNSVNLGSSVKYWKNAYIKTLSLNSLQGQVINDANLVNGTITGGKIADETITGGKIADGTITGGKVADGTITNSKITDETIAGDKIVDGAISNLKLASGAVTTDNLGANAVTAGKMDFTSSHGYAKAGGFVVSGTLSGSFNNVGGDIIVTNPSSGAYAIVIPGITTSDFVVATIYGIDRGGTAAQVSAVNQINVYTYDLGTSAYNDHDFEFIVY